jgi:hypothetical protein
MGPAKKKAHRSSLLRILRFEDSLNEKEAFHGFLEFRGFSWFLGRNAGLSFLPIYRFSILVPFSRG